MSAWYDKHFIVRYFNMLHRHMWLTQKPPSPVTAFPSTVAVIISNCLLTKINSLYLLQILQIHQIKRLKLFHIISSFYTYSKTIIFLLQKADLHVGLPFYSFLLSPFSLKNSFICILFSLDINELIDSVHVTFFLFDDLSL